MSDPIQLIPNKPDKELAEELKKELIEAAQPWLAACTKANNAGFHVTANFAPNYLGQHIIQSLTLSKIY